MQVNKMQNKGFLIEWLTFSSQFCLHQLEICLSFNLEINKTNLKSSVPCKVLRLWSEWFGFYH